jgi:hypothetical protein
MSEGGFEEKVREKRESMINCSNAMAEAIRRYGYTATLDLVVKISTHDDIVSAVLPYFPSIARNALLQPWDKGSDSQPGEGKPETPAPKPDSSPTRRARRTKKEISI